MTQTRLGSFIEAIINVVIGFAINFTANMFIFPLFGFHIAPGANFMLGMIYTVISVVRSYAVRRWFNARLHRLAAAAASALRGEKAPGVAPHPEVQTEDLAGAVWDAPNTASQVDPCMALVSKR